MSLTCFRCDKAKPQSCLPHRHEPPLISTFYQVCHLHFPSTSYSASPSSTGCYPTHVCIDTANTVALNTVKGNILFILCRKWAVEYRKFCWAAKGETLVRIPVNDRCVLLLKDQTSDGNVHVLYENLNFKSSDEILKGTITTMQTFGILAVSLLK